MRVLWLVSLGCGMAFTPSVASAGAIWSDFGPGQSFVTWAGWGFPSTDAVAMPFVPVISASVYQIDIALAACCRAAEQYTVDLETDSGGFPSDTVLQTWAVGVPGTTTGNAYVPEALPTAPIPLSAGTQYWLVVIPDGQGNFWNFNDQGVSGEIAVNSGGGWSFATDNTLGAFDVVTPEPSTFMCLILGLAAVTLRRRTFRV